MSLLLLSVVFFGSILQGLCNQNKWNWPNYSLYVIFGLLLIVAATFRPPTMPDYKEYILALTSGNADRLEPSFEIIKNFWSFFRLNPIGSLFTYASVGVIIILYCIKRDSGYQWFSLALFVSIYFILGEMIQMRQAVSTGLLLLGIPYIRNKRYKKYFLITCIAILFHYSAIIMIPLYFLKNRSHDRVYYIIGLIICFLLGNVVQFGKIVEILNISLISNIYYAKTALLDSTATTPIYMNIRFCIQIIICIFFWVYSSKITRYNTNLSLYLKVYTIGLGIYLLFYSIPDLADRLSSMLLISEIFLIPYVIRIIEPLWIAKAIITVVAMKYFFSSLTSYVLS